MSIKQPTGNIPVDYSNYEEPLCCCEFIDYRGTRSHILAVCCDCDVLDDTCEKMITGNSVPPENYNTLWMIMHDRFRVPCCGGRGAMKIEPSVVLPIFLVPGLIFFAALGPVWTVITVTAIPLLWIYLHKRCLRHSPRTRFFFVWALGSLIFLLSVMEIEVLPYMEIYLYENILHKALVAALLFFIYITKGDPGVLEKYSVEVSPMMDDAEAINRCSTCNVLQINRAGHCRLCNACVSKRDHHCIWLDSCIGAKNHRSFLLALIFLVLCSYYGSLLTLTTICEPMLVMDVFLIPRDCSGVYDNIHLAVCFVSALYTLAIMIVSLCALCHQIYLVSIDTTLQEWRFARRNGSSKKVRNSCSSGSVCLNWYNFCRGNR